MMDLKRIKVKAEGTVLVAKLESPPMNLLGPELVQDLVSLIGYLDKSDTYKVVVFSSANPDYFVPHVDVTKIREYRQVAAQLVGEPSLGLLYRRLSETKAITIAQIEGRARGAGSEFILACDMRFASKERAVFSQIEVALGQIPGAGGIQHLVRQLGRGRAFEVLCSSEDYNADMAERYGWINRALPHAELEAFVMQMAHRIGRFPWEGLLAIKKRINEISLAPVEDFRKDSDIFGSMSQNPETLKRLKTMLARGLQTPGDAEFDLGRMLGEL